MRSNIRGGVTVDDDLKQALIEFLKELTGLVKDARKQLEKDDSKGGE